MADPAKTSRVKAAQKAQEEQREFAKREYDQSVAAEQSAQAAFGAAQARAAVAELTAAAKRAEMTAEETGTGKRPDGTQRLPNVSKPSQAAGAKPANPYYTAAKQAAEVADRDALESRQLADAAKSNKVAAEARRSAAKTSFDDSLDPTAINAARVADAADKQGELYKTVGLYAAGAAIGVGTATAIGNALKSETAKIAKLMPALALGGPGAVDAAQKIQGSVDAIKSKQLDMIGVKPAASRVLKFGAVGGALFASSYGLEAWAANLRETGNDTFADVISAVAVAERAAGLVVALGGVKSAATEPSARALATLNDAQAKLKAFATVSAQATAASNAATAATDVAADAANKMVAAEKAIKEAKRIKRDAKRVAVAAEADARAKVAAGAAAKKKEQTTAKRRRNAKTDAFVQGEKQGRTNLKGEIADANRKTGTKKALVTNTEKKTRAQVAAEKREANKAKGVVQAGKTVAANTAVIDYKKGVAADNRAKGAVQAQITKAVDKAVIAERRLLTDLEKFNARSAGQQARRAAERAASSASAMTPLPGAQVTLQAAQNAVAQTAAQGQKMAQMAPTFTKALKAGGGRGAALAGVIALGTMAMASVGGSSVASAKDRTDPYATNDGRVYARGRKIARD